MLLVGIFGLFVTIFCSITYVGYQRLVRPGIILDQVAAARVDGPTERHLEDEELTGVSRLLAMLGGMISSSPKEDQFTKRELAMGGFRYAGAVRVLGGVKILSAILLLAVALLLRQQMASSKRLFLTALAPIAGYVLPSFALARWTKRRQKAIVRALPDVLDLLVISTEAGCALDKAILSVSKEFRDFHPIISEELATVNAEMLAGSARADALRNFATRTGEPELAKLVAILIQTDRFGTNVADALRTQSEYMRTKRQQDVEEKAAKVGVKLLFPIFIFCLPALLVVVAGSGFLQVIHGLANVNGTH